MNMIPATAHKECLICVAGYHCTALQSPPSPSPFWVQVGGKFGHKEENLKMPNVFLSSSPSYSWQQTGSWCYYY